MLGRAAALQLWAGYLSYPPYATMAPINVTVDTNSLTASVSWVYDVDGQGRKCFPDLETGLKWVTSGSVVQAIGTGQDPSYYSFAGNLSGNTIKGHILERTKPVGDFVWILDAPQVPSSCGEPITGAAVWPLPSSVTQGTTTLAVVPSDNFFTGSSMPPILKTAFQRYMGLTFPHVSSPSPSPGPRVSNVSISVDSSDESFPQLETDESYSLTVSANGAAVIHAATVYGAMRGLETFSQLVVFNFDSQQYTLPDAPWNIFDKPRFPHRGLMIDCARHFLPLATIRAAIDSLPYVKMNVLHIHMSDSQSFPLEIKSHPKLWQGAYSSQERYTQADIAAIVEYGRIHGVRVMVEFDMPGHNAGWCAGYPSLCPSTSCLEPLNVANPDTFAYIKDLLMEMTGGVPSKPQQPSPGLFKDNFIHLGGDEVDTSCWSSTPSIAQWMQQQGFTPDQAYAYFVKTVAGMAIAQGHRPVQWSEVFDHFKDKLPKETIIHIWKSVTNVTEVVADGYNVLVNVGYDTTSWYLDNLAVTWSAVYQNEPCAGVPDNLCPLVLGGHGEMWGETVDASDIAQTVWPRLAAIAERLWSPRNTTNLEAAVTRLENFRCLLNRRGVAAAPVTNAIARSAPVGPGSCAL